MGTSVRLGLKDNAEVVAAAVAAFPSALQHALPAKQAEYRDMKREATEMAVAIAIVIREKVPGVGEDLGVKFIKDLVGLVVNHRGFGLDASTSSIYPQPDTIALLQASAEARSAKDANQDDDAEEQTKRLRRMW